MTDAKMRDDPRNADNRAPLRSVLLAIFLTLCVAITGLIIWHGFQSRSSDLSAISSFFAAVATAIATIWLVAAVFIQSAELRLQRKELEMQRLQIEAQTEETRRLANYNDVLARSASAQDIVTFKNFALGEVQDIFSLNERSFERIYYEIENLRAVESESRYSPAGGMALSYEIADFDDTGFTIEKFERIDSNTSEMNRTNSFRVEYHEIEEILLEAETTLPLRKLILEANDLGVIDWILDRLPFRTSAERMLPRKIRFLLMALVVVTTSYREAE